MALESSTKLTQAAIIKFIRVVGGDETSLPPLGGNMKGVVFSGDYFYLCSLAVAGLGKWVVWRMWFL